MLDADLITTVKKIIDNGYLCSETLEQLQLAYDRTEKPVINLGPWPASGLEPRGCPTPGACSCPVTAPLPDAAQKAMRMGLRALIALRGLEVYEGNPVTHVEVDAAIDALRAQLEAK